MKVICDETNNTEQDAKDGRINVDFVPETLTEVIAIFIERVNSKSSIKIN